MTGGSFWNAPRVLTGAESKGAAGCGVAGPTLTFPGRPHVIHSAPATPARPGDAAARDRVSSRALRRRRIACVRLVAVSAPFLCGLIAPGLAVAEPGEARLNLVRNGSFEGGVDSSFSMERWFINGLPSAVLDDTTKVHGRYSLKIPFSRMALLTKPAQYQGVQFRSAVPVLLEQGREYHFSAYLKADTSKQGEIVITPNSPSEHRGQPLARYPIYIGKNWKRIGMKFKPSVDGYAYWQINVNSKSAGHLWIDAVQLEKDSFAEFRPYSTVEAGLTSDRLGMIFAPDETPMLTLLARNDSAEDIAGFPFKMEVYDLDGRSVYSSVVTSALRAGENLRKGIALPVKKRGIYRCVLSSPASPDVLSELHFSVLPQPRPVSARQSAFGAYLTIAPEPLSIAKRLGFQWIGHLTSNGRIYSWNTIEPVPKDFLWYDEDIALAKHAGFMMMFSLEPCNAPKWAARLTDGEKLAKWTNYVAAMVSHYRDDAVRHWTISDEAQSKKCWSNPQEYAKWHQAGYEAIKKADPEAKVIFNTSAEHAEKVLQVMPPRYVDIIAGNFYHAPPYIERLQKVAERHGIGELWAPGVGRWTLPYYRRHASQEQLKHWIGKNYWAGKVTELAKNAIESFAHGNKRLFHYTATYVGNTNNFSFFEADSGLKPNGVQFGALIWLIDGFTEIRTIADSKPSKGRSIAVFRFDRLDGNSVFAFWSNQASTERLRLLGSATAGVQLYDQFTNPVPVTPTGGGIYLEAGPEPMFLMVSRQMADKIESAYKKALTMIPS